jgi:hypothetical protein
LELKGDLLRWIVVNSIVPIATITEFIIRSMYKTGNSTIESIAYFINNDVVVASCPDWTESTYIADTLRVSINSHSYNLFLRNEAYK